MGEVYEMRQGHGLRRLQFARNYAVISNSLCEAYLLTPPFCLTGTMGHLKWDTGHSYPVFAGFKARTDEKGGKA